MKIVVADKDASILTLVSTCLTSRRYDVQEFSASEELLHYLEHNGADLILLATDMERIGGKFVIEKIREEPHLSTVPVIMLAREEEIAELVLLQEREFDDFLIKPFTSFVLQLRVALNIARSRVRIEANPLTHLPGNIPIEKTILQKIEKGEKFSVLYIDINHFKTFNDYYSFEKGDDVIRQTAKILLQTREKILADSKDCFVGHIGGDDFVVVIDPDFEETFARAFIEEFDRIIPTYYNEEHQKTGFLRVTNRQGKPETFPLMSCSVAACNNLHRTYKNLGEIAQDAAEVKAFLKSQPGSHYLRDRRAEPIKRLEEAVQILAPEVANKKNTGEEEELLGQILIEEGKISQDQLSLALKKQFETSEPLGEILVGMKAVAPEEVGPILSKKLNVPYVALRKLSPRPEIFRIFNTEFMKSHRIFPFELTAKGLKVAMCDPRDTRTLEAVEQASGLRLIPYLTLEHEFNERLALYQGEDSHEEKIG
jgi:diguanylate cyclase (GGDEF)-like protein